MSDHIVIGDRVLLDASFRDAQARLEMLVNDGMLPWASEMAYGEGITSLVTAAGTDGWPDSAGQSSPGRPVRNP